MGFVDMQLRELLSMALVVGAIAWAVVAINRYNRRHDK